MELVIRIPAKDVALVQKLFFEYYPKITGGASKKSEFTGSNYTVSFTPKDGGLRIDTTIKYSSSELHSVTNIPKQDIDLAKKKTMEAVMKALSSPSNGKPTTINGSGYHISIVKTKAGDVDIALNLKPESLKI